MIMNKEIRFYTAEEEARKAAKQSKYNVFYLKSDNWDDYGYKTLFVLNKVVSNGKFDPVGAVKIAQEGQGKGKTELPSEPFNELNKEYFSLGLRQDYYEKLMKLAEAKDVLKKLRDVAYDGDTDAECKEKCIKLLESEEVFKTSLLRSKDLANIVRDFRGIIRDIDSYEVISFSYIFNIEGKSNDIGYSSKELKCAVKLEDFPPSNIHALIGVNGAGKTMLLNKLIKSYIFSIGSTKGTTDDLLEKNNKRVESIGSDKKNDVGKLEFTKDELLPKEELSFSHITYVPVNLTVENGSFSCNPKESEKSIAYDVDIFCQTGFSLPEKGNDDSNIENINNFIKTYADLLVLKHENGERASEIMDSYKYLLNALALTGKSFIPDLDGYVHEDDEKNFIEWISKENLKKLSSGQLKVLYSFYSMTNVNPRGLYIIDEPENSLHAPLLSAFMYALRNVLVKKKAMAIIATHSPVVLREIPRQCVHVLRSREGLRYVTYPSVETFGENLGVLLNEVFGLNADRSGYFTYLKEKAKEVYRAYKSDSSEEKTFEDVYIEKFGAKLGMEARALLPYIVKEAQLEVDRNDNDEKY